MLFTWLHTSTSHGSFKACCSKVKLRHKGIFTEVKPTQTKREGLQTTVTLQRLHKVKTPPLSPFSGVSSAFRWPAILSPDPGTGIYLNQDQDGDVSGFHVEFSWATPTADVGPRAKCIGHLPTHCCKGAFNIDTLCF